MNKYVSGALGVTRLQSKGTLVFIVEYLEVTKATLVQLCIMIYAGIAHKRKSALDRHSGIDNDTDDFCVCTCICIMYTGVHSTLWTGSTYSASAFSECSYVSFCKSFAFSLVFQQP